jgi:hypothetical protein
MSDPFEPLLTLMDAREKLLKEIAQLLENHEEKHSEDLNMTGCIINFDAEHHEFDGQEFRQWSRKWEVRKVERDE